MDAESVKRLAEITAKQVENLTTDDIAVLRARESYLSASERQAFSSVLEEGADTPDGETKNKGGRPRKVAE